MPKSGDVSFWGCHDGNLARRRLPVAVDGISNAVAVAGGRFHSLALLADGTIRAWGSGVTGWGPTPAPAAGISSAVAIAAGNSHSLALAGDGTIRAWGSNENGQLGVAAAPADRFTPVSVTGITTAVAVAAGRGHSLALLADGTVRAWGNNDNGQLGNEAAPTRQPTPVAVTGITAAVAVTAGGQHSLALLADGTVRGWGFGASGQLGPAVPLANFAVAWKPPVGTPIPVVVAGVTGATAIAAGGAFSLALISDGTIRAWGYHEYGQLGCGAGPKNQPVPTAVTGIATAVAITAGGSHSLALLSDGTILAWGNDGSGQLGDDTAVANQPVPVAVAGITNAATIAAGNSHSLAVRTA